MAKNTKSIIFHQVGLMSEHEEETVAWAMNINGVNIQCIMQVILATAPIRS